MSKAKIHLRNKQHLKINKPLFTKLGAVVLCILLVFLMILLQEAGVYIFAPLVLSDQVITVDNFIQLGSNNGTITSLSLLFTSIFMSALIIALVKLKLFARYIRWTYEPQQTLPSGHSSTSDLICSDQSSDESSNLLETNLIKNGLIKNDLKSSEFSSSIKTDNQLTEPKVINNYAVNTSVVKFLGLQNFKWRLAMPVLSLFIIYTIVSEICLHLLGKSPTQFIDPLYLTVHYKSLLIGVVVFAVPIYEELMFRGVMWSALSQQIKGRSGLWLASIFTSILFGWVHAQYDVIEMLIIVGLAIVFCYARVRTGSLFMPIILHIINNALAMMIYIWT